MMLDARCSMAASRGVPAPGIRGCMLHVRRCIAPVSLLFVMLAPMSAQAEGDSLALREEAAMHAAVEAVADSVVQIRTIGGLDTLGGALRADGPTTGLVISADGYVVSSALNFVQRPASILVTFPSGRQAPAELVATDHSRMLVLLKVDAMDDLPVPQFAPVDEIRVGQWAIAVGRTFRADRTNLSVGIVSATDRMFGKVLQTDAAVSTANYGGPLVDIRGRVLGVIVPMAPQGTSEVAGVEWYDSGIGFAAPLAAITDRLEQMKQGKDQYAGLLGISLDGKRPHESSAKLAAVRPNSPAGKAGLRKGDQIVDVDGRAIHTQTDLRFALGPRYGGESVRVVALRGEERIERTFTLVGKLKVFRHAMLGILPMRPTRQPTEPADDAKEDADDAAADSQPASGIRVRMVCPGSPAAEAGIVPGDRVVRINDTPIATVSDAIAEMNTVAPGTKVTVGVLRGQRMMDLSLAAVRLPTTVPDDLPGAYPTKDEQPQQQPADAKELKLPEFDQTCKVYVPASHEAGCAQGVLLWLHAPGRADPDEVIRRWQPICDRDRLILIVPTATDEGRWERTELEYLRRLAERVVASHHVDPRRVVVYGEGGGGEMAYLLALASRDLFTGVATASAPLPRQIRVPENDPALRLAVLSASAPGGDSAATVARGLEKLTEAGYPVTTMSLSDAGGNLSSEERETLARWSDTLDRF
jgi:serine protease Do